MKKLIICAFLIFSVGILKAQKVQYAEVPPLDIPLMDRTWELIAKKTFKKTTNGKEIPVFPAALQAMNNKKVDLSGYMVAVKMGMTHTVFMLAVVPANQCQFCGMAGIPDMVEVHTVKPIRFTDEPITIVGKLVLKTPDDYSSNVFLVDADQYN
jgi:hypothetical protein